MLAKAFMKQIGAQRGGGSSHDMVPTGKRCPEQDPMTDVAVALCSTEGEKE